MLRTRGPSGRPEWMNSASRGSDLRLTEAPREADATSANAALSLADVPMGGALVVERVQGGDVFQRRLYGLGFLPGVSVRVLRRMPLGGPLEVEVSGARLGIRVRDARCLRGSPV